MATGRAAMPFSLAASANKASSRLISVHLEHCHDELPVFSALLTDLQNKTPQIVSNTLALNGIIGTQRASCALTFPSATDAVAIRHWAILDTTDI